MSKFAPIHLDENRPSQAELQAFEESGELQAELNNLADEDWAEFARYCDMSEKVLDVLSQAAITIENAYGYDDLIAGRIRKLIRDMR